MTYDDWKTTDPSEAHYCSNGHYHCPPCPITNLHGDRHASCECDHDSDDQDSAAAACETAPIEKRCSGLTDTDDSSSSMEVGGAAAAGSFNNKGKA